MFITLTKLYLKSPSGFPEASFFCGTHVKKTAKTVVTITNPIS